MRIFRILTLALTVFSNISHASDTKVIVGQWGGNGISLFATPSGADGGFYCSFGRILDPITIDKDGNFCATGYVDVFDGTQNPVKHRVSQFSGTVVDKQMHLTVKMPGQADWVFDLVRGEKGQTYACEN